MCVYGCERTCVCLCVYVSVFVRVCTCVCMCVCVCMFGVCMHMRACKMSFSTPVRWTPTSEKVLTHTCSSPTGRARALIICCSPCVFVARPVSSSTGLSKASTCKQVRNGGFHSWLHKHIPPVSIHIIMKTCLCIAHIKHPKGHAPCAGWRVRWT